MFETESFKNLNISFKPVLGKESEEPEENKESSIWRAITGIVTGLYAGGSMEGATLSSKRSVVPPKPDDV